MLIFGQVILLLVSCLALVKSTEMVVAAIKQLARLSRVGAYGVTAFILALATSFPELSVAIMASIEGSQSVILGNVIGSNIADISMVVAIPAIIGGGLKVNGGTLKRDFVFVFLAGVLPVLLLEDLTLSRSDGVILIATYVIFVLTVLSRHTRALGEYAMRESSVKRLFDAMVSTKARGDMGRFVIGVLGLLLASYLIVKLAESVALGLGLPLLVVGLVIVSFGTTLPELTFGIRAVLSRGGDMAMGNLLGSVVANATLILGVAAVIRPMVLPARGLMPYMSAIAAFVVIYLMFASFTTSRGRLSRTEAMALLLIYIGFVFWEVSRA